MRKLLTFASIAMCIGLFGCSRKPDSDVTVRNDSNSVIAEAKIIICKQTFVAKNIEHGEERTFNYFVKGDSGYHIAVRFSDGHSLEKEDGYVTTGFAFHDLLIVDDNDITIVSKVE